MEYEHAKIRLLTKWLVACVHCSLGWKINDVMLILISPQGKFKTSFLNHLVPKKLQDYLFTGHIEPKITDNKTANLMAEKFFVNIDDQMETIFGKDFNNMKAIISADSITNRKLYKSFSPKRPRICNFIGSVNNPQFLTDNQNRRYLCFEITELLKDYQDINIDKLWAEAYHLAKKTKIYEVFTAEDRSLINEICSDFTMPTVEEEYLQNLFTPSEDNGAEDIVYMKTSEILKCVQEVSGNRQLSMYRLGTAIRRKNYLFKSKRLDRAGGEAIKVYVLKLKPSAVMKLNEKGISISDFK